MNGHNFFIHQSNRAEVLARELAHLLTRYRKQAFSLKPDVVLVNNYEMGQWLAIQIAEETGICANVEFRLAGSFLWQRALGVAAAQDPDVITKEQLTWLIFRLLHHGDPDETDAAKGHDVQAETGLFRYLERCPSQDLFSLSSALADTFDRYLNYRPDMLRQWEKGLAQEEQDWQPWLWAGLSRLRQGRQFRVDYLSDLAKGFLQGKIPADFPERLFVFGISHMPPLHMELLHAISGSVPVHLFILNPCRRYWLDIRPEKFRSAAKNRLAHEDVESLFPAGNPLLASMGQAGRAFLTRLYGFEFFEGKDLFIKNEKGPDGADLADPVVETPGTLHTIQDDLLELRALEPDNRPEITSDDDSIRIHSCHSPLRQVEVLHDCLVDLFETDPDITPEKVLIMAPNMKEFSPLIKAVFDAAPEEQRLPYFLAEMPLDQSNPAIYAFLKLFSACKQQITAPDLIDLLSLPVVMARYNIDEQDVSIVRNWIRGSGARRGIVQLSSGLTVYENTLAFGLDRLYAAYSFPESSDTALLPEFSLCPYDTALEGDDAARLSFLSAFTFHLHELSEKLMPEGKDGLTCLEWRDLFDWIIRAFLCQDMEEAGQEIEVLKETLSGILTAVEEAEIERLDYRQMLPVVHHYLSKTPPPRSFITGRITFSNMVPMRALPFDVICLLGMNSGEFPRRPIFPAFDLVARDFRPGDRIPRDEDRYLFLETLICARRKLWIFYEGRRQKDDAPLAPSTVVDELLSYIDDRFSPPDEGYKKASDAVKIQHPLQPFSRRYLDGRMDGRYRVYCPVWCPVDEEGNFLKRQEVPPFCREPIPLDQEEREGLLTVSPKDLGWFFASPCRHFLMKRLGIDAAIVDDAIEADEPDALGNSARILVMNRLLDLAKTGPPEDLEEIFRPLPMLMKARGEMPPLFLGKVKWQRFLSDFKPKLDNFINKKIKVFGVPETPLLIEGSTIQLSENLTIEVSGMAGKVNGSGTLLEYTEHGQIYNTFRARMWAIDILLSCARPEEWKGDIVIAVMGGTNLELKALDPEDAQEMATVLARLYLQGLEAPLPLIPRYSYPFAKEFLKNKKNEQKSQLIQTLMEDEVPQEVAEEHLEPVIEKLINGSRFNSYGARWDEYAFRTKRRGGLEPLLWSHSFRKSALQFFNGFFAYYRKGV